MLDRIQSLLSKLANGAVILGALGLLLSMFFGVGDVVGTLFRHPLPGALELTESTMVVIVFGGLALGQIRQRHLRVELAYLKAGPRMRSMMDIVAALAGVLFFGLLLWQSYNEALFSLAINEKTSGLVRMPLWPARFALVIGTAIMILQLLLDMIRDIVKFGVDKEFELA